MQKVKAELSPHEVLIREGLALERKIKRAEDAEKSARHRAYEAVWEFGDWLVENTVKMTLRDASALSRGGEAPGLTCAEYARRSNYSNITLSKYRRVAAAFPKAARGVASVSLCDQLLAEFEGDSTAAVEALPERIAAVERTWTQRAAHGLRSRLRASLTVMERMEARSFAEAAEFLGAAASFAESAGRVVAELDLSDAERAELVERMSRIDAALAEFPVGRPKRPLFRWLRAA